MTSYYFWCFLFLIQLGMKYVKADIVNKTMKCEGGELVQYGHSFECLCPKGFVNATREKCIKQTELEATCTSTNAGRPCGRFAVCGKKGATDACVCLTKYATPASGNPQTDCKPEGCEDPQCGDGICTLHDDAPMCTCKIGYGHTDAQNKKSKCIAVAEKQKCELQCTQYAHCVVKKEGHYACECVNKEPFEPDGTCKGNAFKAFLSPLNVLLILAVYVMSVKST